MQVILLESIRRLGGLGDLVNVKPGFARNYLIPQGKAEVATQENRAKFEERRSELEKQAQDARLEAQARADRLQELAQITLSVLASQEGRLYGSVTARDVALAVKQEADLDIDAKEVHLNDGAIHELGEHTVTFQFYDDISASLQVLVVEKEA